MLDILFRDAHFVAVHKPKGMLVHRTSWCPRERACLELLSHQIRKLIYPVHRLDRATSGIVVFAMDPDAAARLSSLFRERLVDKRYLAVVRGFMDPMGRISDPLKRATGGVHHAITEYWCEATVELRVPVGKYATGRYSLVRVKPLTGRHHQIRRHFAHQSHPIIGDTKHGDSAHNRFFRDRLGIDRLLLMATDLSFAHPFHGNRVHIHAPLSTEVIRFLSLMGWACEPRPVTALLAG